MSDSGKRLAKSKAQSGTAKLSMDGSTDTSFDQLCDNFFRDFEAQLQEEEYKKPSSRFLAHLDSTLAQGLHNIKVLEQLLKCKRAYRDYLRNGGDVLRGMSQDVLNAHPMKDKVVEMCEVNHSSREEQIKFVKEFKQFRIIQKTEQHMELTEDQMRRVKKVDAVKKVVNYHVDQLVKLDGEIIDQEQARKS